MRPRWALEHGLKAKQQRQHPLLLIECVGHTLDLFFSEVCIAFLSVYRKLTLQMQDSRVKINRLLLHHFL